MKKLIPVLAALVVFATVFSGCNKDRTCHVKISVENESGQKITNVWLVTKLPNTTPPGNRMEYNTQTFLADKNYVEFDFDLPAVIVAEVFPEGTTDFDNAIPLKTKQGIKLNAGETEEYVVVIPD